MAYKLIDAAQACWRAVNARHLVALARRSRVMPHRHQARNLMSENHGIGGRHNTLSATRSAVRSRSTWLCSDRIWCPC